MFCFFFVLLETPWLLYGIIIGLSSGYALLMIGGIIYGLIKLGRWIRTKVSTFFNKRREQAEPTALHLRQLQDNVRNLRDNLTQAWKSYLFNFHMRDKMHNGHIMVLYTWIHKLTYLWVSTWKFMRRIKTYFITSVIFYILSEISWVCHIFQLLYNHIF